MRRFFSKLFYLVFFFISVPKCASCSEKLNLRDDTLCPDCLEKYRRQKGRSCSLCSEPLPLCSCPNELLKKHSVKRLIKCYRYLPYEDSQVGNRLIFSLKQENRRDLRLFLARELIKSIKASVELTNKDSFLITNVPRRRKAIRSFGFDHSARLAKCVAGLLGIKYKDTIISKSKRAQKETEGADRLKNARFLPKNACKREIHGKRIILIDDIVTTGASMCRSADVLKSFKPKEIIGAAVAIAYKDSYQKRQ